MDVRLAKSEDKIHVISMLRRAHVAAGFGSADNPASYPFSAAYADRAFLSHTSTQDAICLVLECQGKPVGVLMARVFDYELGPVRVAKETAWWVDEAHRGASSAIMIDEYEKWASAAGASFVGMAALEAAPRAGLIYRRKGYAPIETHFVKSLAG